MKAIYISIKPVHLNRIISGEKTYEFRNYIPKDGVDTLFVYESSPVCELRYVIKVGKIIEYPNKILKKGIGNEEFNRGNKKSKYAYEIKEVYKLDKFIPLKVLKEDYGFNPPQAYAYSDRYLKLTDYIINSKKIKA